MVVFFLLIYYYSQKHYPLPFEIQKIIKIIFTGIVLYLVSNLTIYIDYFTGVMARILLLFAYPFILYLWNFYEEIEIAKVKNLVYKVVKQR